MQGKSFFSQGNFFTGCNYWASHAGTAMWSDWNAGVVDKDLKSLSDSGLQVLRVFPLWADFQPITLLRANRGNPLEFQQGGEPLSDSVMGCEGVSQTAVSHFEELLQMAEKYGLKLIISLINGWMSGRLFVPPALEGRNILTDPMAIMWQIRFVKYFVGRFINEEAIIAWEPGNECNCMSKVESREEAWLWTASIVDAIKSIDKTRAVLSGMHGLTMDGIWTIPDQGELTNVLTVHPYPLFTPYCDLDPINTMRGIIHASAQACYYSDIGGKPCFAEEFGTLGPMISSDLIAGDFVRASLFSQWANGGLGGLWWCAFDQEQLSHAPYNWYAAERELGLIRSDGTKKPVLEEMRKFAELIEGLPFKSLPERIRDGVCILTDGQDHWGAAFGAFMLAKQAGCDLEFQYATQPLKQSALYFMPCLSGLRVIDRHRWLELLQKVAEGAVLYISYNDGVLSSFKEATGVEVQTFRKQHSMAKVDFKGIEPGLALSLERDNTLELKSINAEVLGTDPSGNIAFSFAVYGKGKVYFLAFPMETQLAGKSGVFCGENAEPYWKIYRYIHRSVSNVTSKRAVHVENPNIGVTEHLVDERNRIVVLVNYSPTSVDLSLSLSGDWKTAESLYGEQAVQEQSLYNSQYNIKINKNDAAVFNIKRGAIE